MRLSWIPAYAGMTNNIFYLKQKLCTFLVQSLDTHYITISRILLKIIIYLGLLLLIDSSERTFWASAKATAHNLRLNYEFHNLCSEALAKGHCSFSKQGLPRHLITKSRVQQLLTRDQKLPYTFHLSRACDVTHFVRQYCLCGAIPNVLLLTHWWMLSITISN